MQVSVITDSLLSIKGDEEMKGRDGDQRNREGRNTRDSVQVRRIQLKWTSSEEEDERE